MDEVATLGNKLPFIHENPLDIICLKVAESISPAFHKAGATPNMITTLSVIASALAVWNVYKGGPKIWFVIWALLSYFFDCLDGHYARRYDMCTKFGDYYDHLSDWAYFIALFYVAFIVRGLTADAKKYKILIFGAIVFVGIGTMIHMGLQESIYQPTNAELESEEDINESPTLNIFANLANTLCALPKECILATRWLGVGTFIGVMIAIIVFFVK